MVLRESQHDPGNCLRRENRCFNMATDWVRSHALVYVCVYHYILSWCWQCVGPFAHREFEVATGVSNNHTARAPCRAVMMALY